MSNCIQCFRCGVDVNSSMVKTSFPYGKKMVEIPVTLKVFRCENCNEEWCDHTAEEAKEKALKEYLQENKL